MANLTKPPGLSEVILTERKSCQIVIQSELGYDLTFQYFLNSLGNIYFKICSLNYLSGGMWMKAERLRFLIPLVMKLVLNKFLVLEIKIRLRFVKCSCSISDKS